MPDKLLEEQQMPLFVLLAATITFLGIQWATLAIADTSMDSLDPAFRVDAEKALADCKAAGVPLRVVETGRSLARQTYLYSKGRDAQGRIVLPAQVVTWELFSRHIPKGKAVAIDVTPIGAKSDADARTKLSSVYPIWNKYGLQSLSQAHPGTPDYGHFQRIGA